MKRLVIVFCMFIMYQAYAGTLFIAAKKHGLPLMRMEHIHVIDYGWNSAGAFVVFLSSGREIFYGRRSHWEYFEYWYVPDNEMLLK